MTKTALRALTVVALSAAVLASTALPALADDTDLSNPDINVTVCMTQPELCQPDPAYAPTDVTPPSSYVPSGPIAQPAPLPPTAPAASTRAASRSTGDAGTAPAALDGEKVPGQASQPVSTAPAAAALPSWVVLDRAVQILRVLLRAFTGQPAAVG